MKAIFFDLDGTLIDSSVDLASAVNVMLEKLNKPTFEIETIRSWIGGGAAKLVQRALKESGGIENFDKALEIFLKHYNKNLTKHTVLFDDVVEVLETLYKNYTLTLITNKPYKFTIPILKHFDIEKYFKIVLGAESLEYKKPHPLPLLHCIDKLGISKDECIMVGDSKNDIIAANEAGVKSVLLSYGFGDDEKYNPTFVCNELKDILKCIK